ncbi:hypothetical protein [Komagataeibacter kakiaceti]
MRDHADHKEVFGDAFLQKASGSAAFLKKGGTQIFIGLNPRA